MAMSCCLLCGCEEEAHGGIRAKGNDGDPEFTVIDEEEYCTGCNEACSFEGDEEEEDEDDLEDDDEVDEEDYDDEEGDDY
jgi:uncharacterized protein CbrC (UPF0167 family)